MSGMDTFHDLSLFATPIITMRVGPEKVPVTAHKGLLVEVPFFAKALSSDFVEGQTQSIDFPEDDVETVTAYVRYLYTGHSLTDELCRTRTKWMEPDEREDFLIQCAALWMFSDRVRQLELAERVEGDIIATAVGVPLEFVRYVYENTASESALRVTVVNLVVDAYTSEGLAALHKYVEGLSFAAELMYDIARLLVKEKENVGEDMEYRNE